MRPVTPVAVSRTPSLKRNLRPRYSKIWGLAAGLRFAHIDACGCGVMAV